MVEKKLLSRWPQERWSHLTILVACSGGADSTALTLALHRLCPPSTTILLAHWNHRLRGAESEADAAFVRNFAENLGLQLFEGETTSESDPSAAQETISDEASLRTMRYQFLQNTAYSHGARYVVVGHQANDQVETVLHNLFRGSGLSGLRGMLPFRGIGEELVLARPMIDVSRSEVLDYLKHHKQSFRTDSSNSSEAYTRNRIRNKVLPIIQEQYGRDVQAAITNAANLLGDVFEDIQARSQKWSTENIISIDAHRFRVNCMDPASVPWHVVQQAIVDEYHRRRWALGGYNRGHWESIRSLFSGESKADARKEMLPNRIRIDSTKDYIEFEHLWSAPARRSF